MWQYLIFVGAIVQLIGIYSYIKETIKGNTKPNKITWLMWSIAPLIATFAAIAKGVGWSVLPVFMSGFALLLVFLASFLNKKSYWKLEKFDYFCGACSALALILWVITKEPVVAIVFAIASDGFAAVPTLIKSWKHPETETIHAYTTGLFNAFTSFTAINVWNFSSVAFPIYLIIINFSLILSVCSHKIFKKKKNMNYKGVIIEESLENKDILKRVKILSTKVEQVVEKHKTPWLKQWTLHTVEIPNSGAEEIADEISKSLESKHQWYADFKNDTTHFIIFKNKVFKIDRTSKGQYDKAKEYGILLGITPYQVDFHPEVKEWKR